MKYVQEFFMLIWDGFKALGRFFIGLLKAMEAALVWGGKNIFLILIGIVVLVSLWLLMKQDSSS